MININRKLYLIVNISNVKKSSILNRFHVGEIYCPVLIQKGKLFIFISVDKFCRALIR